MTLEQGVHKLMTELERQKATIRAARQIQKILARLPDDETRQKVLVAITT